MNSRLKELAEQSGINFGGHPMNPLNVYPEQLEQFAELVIKDYNSQPLPTNDGLHWDIKL